MACGDEGFIPGSKNLGLGSWELIMRALGRRPQGDWARARARASARTRTSARTGHCQGFVSGPAEHSPPVKASFELPSGF